MVSLTVLTTVVSLTTVVVPDNAKIWVIDGDTIDINGTRIRLLQIDTPELHGARCFKEYKLALLAKRRLNQLLRRGDISYVANGKDKYGRTLAWVYVGKEDVGQILIKEGHAVTWEPGPEAWSARYQRWCGEELK